MKKALLLSAATYTLGIASAWAGASPPSPVPEIPSNSSAFVVVGIVVAMFILRAYFKNKKSKPPVS